MPANGELLSPPDWTLRPPHYRGTCQSFLPLFQSLSAFGSAAVTGYLSDIYGIHIALELTLLVGAATAWAILWFALALHRRLRKTKNIGNL